MKLEYTGSKVSLVAENVQDVHFLVSVVKPEKISRGPWKGKHRKTCVICGKKKKNMGLHVAIAHNGVKVGTAARAATQV